MARSTQEERDDRKARRREDNPRRKDRRKEVEVEEEVIEGPTRQSMDDLRNIANRALEEQTASYREGSIRPSEAPHKDYLDMPGGYSYRLYDDGAIEIIEVPPGKEAHLNTFPKVNGFAFNAIEKQIKGEAPSAPAPTGDGAEPDPDPAASVDVNVEATTPEGDVDIREILQSFPKQMERQDQREAVKQSFPRKLEQADATSSLGLPLVSEVDAELALEDQTTPSSENRIRDDLSQAAGRTAKTAGEYGVYNLANILANAKIAALGGLKLARMPGDAAVSAAKQVGEEALEAGEGFLKGYKEE